MPPAEDANFYIILSLRNFNRGPPMLPAASEDLVSMTISAGEPWHWAATAGAENELLSVGLEDLPFGKDDVELPEATYMSMELSI